MPVSCSQSALTGASGYISFKPAGGDSCLQDFTDFPAGDDISVPSSADYRVGDKITFTHGLANPDSGLGFTGAGGPTETVDVYVVAVGPGTIQVSATQGGTPLTMQGNGGVTGADTPGAHLEVSFTDYEAVCSVTEWSMSLTKEQTDVTTLPCNVSTSGSRVAPVRKQQGTFLNGEGSLSVLFTSDQTSMGQRLLGNSVMIDSVVDAKLYVDAVSGGFATINDTASNYYEGPLTLLGFEITVNTTDAIVATVNYSLADQPKVLFGITL